MAIKGGSKHCSNNARRAEREKFPLQIKAQSTNFKFWLTLVRLEENSCDKLSKEVYKDIKRIKAKSTKVL